MSLCCRSGSRLGPQQTKCWQGMLKCLMFSVNTGILGERTTQIGKTLGKEGNLLYHIKSNHIVLHCIIYMPLCVILYHITLNHVACIALCQIKEQWGTKIYKLYLLCFWFTWVFFSTLLLCITLYHCLFHANNYHLSTFLQQAAVREECKPARVRWEGEHWEKTSKSEQWRAVVASPHQPSHVTGLFPTASFLLYITYSLVPTVTLLILHMVWLPYSLSWLPKSSSILLSFPQSCHQSKFISQTCHTHSQSSRQSGLFHRAKHTNAPSVS